MVCGLERGLAYAQPDVPKQRSGHFPRRRRCGNLLCNRGSQSGWPARGHNYRIDRPLRRRDLHGYATCPGTEPYALKLNHGIWGDAQTVSVEAWDTWTATANNPWLSVSPGSGGVGTTTLTVTGQPYGGLPRTGSITIGGTTLNVTQNGPPVTLSPSLSTFPATGGSATTTVDAPIGWSAVTGASWLSINPASGPGGTSSATVTVQTNPQVTPRSTTLTINGSTFTVTQDARITTLTTSSYTFPIAGGSTSFSVIASAAWTATSNDAWLSFSPTSGGAGSTVSVATAAPNTGAARTGTITIGDSTFTATQAQPNVMLSSYSGSYSSGGGVLNISVNASAPWSASTIPSWVTVSATSASAGTLQASITTAPTTGASRTANVILGDAVYTVTQAGPPVTLSTTSFSFASTGGTASVEVSGGYAWSVTPGSEWLTVDKTSGGPATTTVTITAAPNAGAARTGTLYIGGTLFTANQARGAVVLSPISHEFTNGPGSKSITVDATAPWTVTTPSWLTASPASGSSGASTLNLTASGNLGAPRTGTVTVGDATFTATQAGPAVTLSKSSYTFPTGGGSTSLSLNASSAWIASSNGDWLVMAQASGSSGTTVTSVIAAANTGGPRSATLYVGNAPFQATQPGQVTLAAASTTFTGGGGTYSLGVTATGTWNAISSAGWLTLSTSSGGAGTTNLVLTAAPNPGSGSRTATVTLGDAVFSVTQSGPQVNLSKYSHTFGQAGGTTNLSISSYSAWTATSNAAWLTLGTTGGAAGTTLTTVTTSAITSGTRTGTISIGDATFTATQNAGASITPGSHTYTSEGGPLSIAIDSVAAWTAVSNTPWLSINVNGGLAGTTTATVTAGTNRGGGTRTGSLLIGDTLLVLTQNGPQVVLTPASRAFLSSGESITVTVSAGYPWTSGTGDWLSISPTSGSAGSTTATVTAPPNTGLQTRSATLAVGDATFSGTQARASTYAEWTQTYWPGVVNPAITDDLADPDHDGLPNLLEYAFGTNPTRPSVSTVTTGSAQTYPTLTFTRPHPAYSDITYTIQATTEMTGAFSPSGLIEVSTEVLPDGRAKLIYRDSAMPTEFGGRYLRIQVTRP